MGGELYIKKPSECRHARLTRIHPQLLLPTLNRVYFTVAGRNAKGSAGWNCAAALPAKMAPPVSVSFFVGLRAAKSISAREAEYTEQCSAEDGIRIRKTSRVSSLSFHRSQVTGH